MTSTVAIHLTETGVWSCCDEVEWAGSVVVRSSSDGSVSAVLDTECRSPEDSPLRFLEDDHLDVDGGVVSLPDALVALLRAVTAKLGFTTSVDSLVLSYPTEWGSRRRSTLEEAGSSVSARTILVPVACAIARSAGEASAAPGTSRNIIVLECRPSGTTASYLVSGPDGLEVVDCDHDPDPGVEDPGTVADTEIAALAERVSRDRSVDRILVAGLVESLDFSSLHRAVGGVFAETVDVRSVSGTTIARALEFGWRDRVDQPPVPATPRVHWLEPAPEPAERRGPRPGWLVGAAMTVVLVIGLWAVFAPARHESGGGGGAVAELESTSASTSLPALAPTSAAQPVRAEDAVLDRGRFRLTVPERWRERTLPPNSPSVGRTELMPDGGADRRIILVQNEVRAGSGYREVAATLAEKRAVRMSGRGEPGLFGAIESGVVFGGRSGLSYEEFPDENSLVEWHVLVEHDLQVSIGCQFLLGEWAAIESECEQVVGSVVIIP